MELLTIITVLCVSLYAGNICDYVAFSAKHRETQDKLRVLTAEVSSLRSTIGYLTDEVKKLGQK